MHYCCCSSSCSVILSFHFTPDLLSLSWWLTEGEGSVYLDFTVKRHRHTTQLMSSAAVAVCTGSSINIAFAWLCLTRHEESELMMSGFASGASGPSSGTQPFWLKLRGALPVTGLILSFHLPFLLSPARIFNAPMNMHPSLYGGTRECETYAHFHRHNTGASKIWDFMF